MVGLFFNIPYKQRLIFTLRLRMIIAHIIVYVVVGTTLLNAVDNTKA